MTSLRVWIDAQRSPALAPWLSHRFGVEAVAVRDLGLHQASDRQIFLAACDAAVVVMTKDSDFVQLLERLGPPPRVLWITCGNTSNAHLRGILEAAWTRVVGLLDAGEVLVEVSDRR